MGRCIIKIKDRYFEWSSVVDAPVTYAMTEDELREHYQMQYGLDGLRHLPSVMHRVELTGTSARGYTLDEILAGNRAGPNETRLTENEIYERYLTPPEEE